MHLIYGTEVKSLNFSKPQFFYLKMKLVILNTRGYSQDLGITYSYSWQQMWWNLTSFSYSQMSLCSLCIAPNFSHLHVFVCTFLSSLPPWMWYLSTCEQHTTYASFPSNCTHLKITSSVSSTLSFTFAGPSHLFPQPHPFFQTHKVLTPLWNSFHFTPCGFTSYWFLIVDYLSYIFQPDFKF